MPETITDKLITGERRVDEFVNKKESFKTVELSKPYSLGEPDPPQFVTNRLPTLEEVPDLPEGEEFYVSNNGNLSIREDPRINSSQAERVYNNLFSREEEDAAKLSSEFFDGDIAKAKKKYALTWHLADMLDMPFEEADSHFDANFSAYFGDIPVEEAYNSSLLSRAAIDRIGGEDFKEPPQAGFIDKKVKELIVKNKSLDPLYRIARSGKMNKEQQKRLKMEAAVFNRTMPAEDAQRAIEQRIAETTSESSSLPVVGFKTMMQTTGSMSYGPAGTLARWLGLTSSEMAIYQHAIEVNDLLAQTPEVAKKLQAVSGSYKSFGTAEWWASNLGMVAGVLLPSYVAYRAASPVAGLVGTGASMLGVSKSIVTGASTGLFKGIGLQSSLQLAASVLPESASFGIDVLDIRKNKVQEAEIDLNRYIESLSDNTRDTIISQAFVDAAVSQRELINLGANEEDASVAAALAFKSTFLTSLIWEGMGLGIASAGTSRIFSQSAKSILMRSILLVPEALIQMENELSQDRITAEAALYGMIKEQVDLDLFNLESIPALLNGDKTREDFESDEEFYEAKQKFDTAISMLALSSKSIMQSGLKNIYLAKNLASLDESISSVESTYKRVSEDPNAPGEVLEVSRKLAEISNDDRLDKIDKRIQKISAIKVAEAVRIRREQMSEEEFQGARRRTESMLEDSLDALKEKVQTSEQKIAVSTDEESFAVQQVKDELDEFALDGDELLKNITVLPNQSYLPARVRLNVLPNAVGVFDSGSENIYIFASSLVRAANEAAYTPEDIRLNMKAFTRSVVLHEVAHRGIRRYMNQETLDRTMDMLVEDYADEIVKDAAKYSDVDIQTLDINSKRRIAEEWLFRAEMLNPKDQTALEKLVAFSRKFLMQFKPFRNILGNLTENDILYMMNGVFAAAKGMYRKDDKRKVRYRYQQVQNAKMFDDEVRKSLDDFAVEIAADAIAGAEYSDEDVAAAAEGLYDEQEAVARVNALREIYTLAENKPAIEAISEYLDKNSGLVFFDRRSELPARLIASPNILLEEFDGAKTFVYGIAKDVSDFYGFSLDIAATDKELLEILNAEDSERGAVLAKYGEKFGITPESQKEITTKATLIDALANRNFEIDEKEILKFADEALKNFSRKSDDYLAKRGSLLYGIVGSLAEAMNASSGDLAVLIDDILMSNDVRGQNRTLRKALSSLSASINRLPGEVLLDTLLDNMGKGNLRSTVKTLIHMNNSEAGKINADIDSLQTVIREAGGSEALRAAEKNLKDYVSSRLQDVFGLEVFDFDEVIAEKRPSPKPDGSRKSHLDLFPQMVKSFAGLGNRPSHEISKAIGNWVGIEDFPSEMLEGLAKSIAESVKAPAGKQKAKAPLAVSMEEYFTGVYHLINRMRDMIRFGAESERNSALEAIDKIDTVIQTAYDYEQSLLRQEVTGFLDAVKVAYGKSHSTAILELTKPRAEYAKYSEDGNTPLSKDNLFNIYAALSQQDTSTNVAGIDVDEILKEFDESDKQILNYLRVAYARAIRASSIAASRRLGSKTVEVPLGYLPVSFEVSGGFDFNSGGFVPSPPQLRPKNIESLKLDRGAGLLQEFIPNINRLIRFRSWVASGISKGLIDIFNDGSLNEAITRVHGKEYARGFYDHLQQVISGEKTGPRINLLEYARSYTALTKIGWNFSVALKQLTSIPAFALEIGMIDTAKYFASAFTPDGFKAMEAIVDSPQMRNRMRIGVDEGMANALSAKFPKGTFGRAVNQGPRAFFQKGFILTQYMDRLAIQVVAQGIYRAHIEKFSAEGKESGAAEQMAMTRTWAIIQRTQQSSAIKDQPLWLRRGGTIGATVAQFTGTPSQYASYEILALRELNAGVRNGNTSQIKQALSRLAVNHIFLGAGYYVLSQIVRGMFDGDDEFLDGLEDVDVKMLVASLLAGPAAGLIFFGSITEEFIKRVLNVKSYYRSGIPAAAIGNEVSMVLEVVKELRQGDLDAAREDSIKLLFSVSPGAKQIWNVVKTTVKKME